MERLRIDSLKSRLKRAGDSWGNESGKCILYVMSRDQRICDNFGLLAAQKHAIKLGLPLAVVFVLHVVAQGRAQEHYEFMLDGLSGVEAELKKKNIPFVALIGKPIEKLRAVCFHFKPVAVYMDFNPLRGSRILSEELAANVPVIIVDSHNVVPVWLASNKQEVGARTLRPKLNRLLADFLVEPGTITRHPVAWPGKDIIALNKIREMFAETLRSLPKNSVKTIYKSGESAALAELNEFISERFLGYEKRRNDPTANGLTNLSPYLHFGQISSLRIAITAKIALSKNIALQNDYNRLIEELIVRKELSDNYCYYNRNYDSLLGAPEWARRTLSKHQTDPREFTYTRKQFELAQTHDLAWNAAERQLTTTGKMHGYMRMYWAKKVLEWSSSPDEALQTLIYLNDFYSIDGGDPNGYVGILWSIAGLHDRPWGERSVYGTVRCMVYSGLKRKFDINAYQNEHVML